MSETENPTAAPGSAPEPEFDLQQWRRELGQELRDDRDGTDLDSRLQHAAGIAIGAASVCWEDMSGTGVFADDRARAILEELVDTVRELIDRERADALQRASKENAVAHAFASMVADLDRNAHGRHEGDVDAGDPTGISQGNPRLATGDLLGHSVHGSWEYRVPERGRRHDPGAWKVRPQ